MERIRTWQARCAGIVVIVCIAPGALAGAAGHEGDDCAALCEQQYLQDEEKAAAQHAADLVECRREVGIGLLKSAGQVALLAAMALAGRDVYIRMFAGRERTAVRVLACAFIALWLLHITIRPSMHDSCVRIAFLGERVALRSALSGLAGCCRPCDKSECWALFRTLETELDAMEQQP